MNTLAPNMDPTLKMGSVWGSRLFRSVAAVALALSALAFANASGATATSSTAVGEANNGKIVVVHQGGRVVVTLHSTYWTLLPLGHQKVLSQAGTTKTVGVLQGCVPGQGCGTVTSHFIAKGVGTVHLHATRTTCGEALHCSPAQSTWTVTIRVR